MRVIEAKALPTDRGGSGAGCQRAASVLSNTSSGNRGEVTVPSDARWG